MQSISNLGEGFEGGSGGGVLLICGSQEGGNRKVVLVVPKIGGGVSKCYVIPFKKWYKCTRNSLNLRLIAYFIVKIHKYMARSAKSLHLLRYSGYNLGGGG